MSFEKLRRISSRLFIASERSYEVKKILFFALSLLVTGTTAVAEDVKKIQDNSFLIEEAYNQEPGVVQHIQTFQYMDDHTWGYSFTQEWPAPGETHQLSYTIPVSRFDDTAEVDINDVLLNYRYQLINRDGKAMAPRLSLVLPTGDDKKGFGKGALGFQTNIPLS
jgi:hypothetical protein